MKYSFRRGYSQIPRYRAKELKNRIMDVFGIRGEVSWYAHLSGKIEPKVSEYEAIEAIFAEYGIKEVWGCNKKA